MSKDNWIAIVETKHKQPLYYGYDLSASMEYSNLKAIKQNKPVFCTANIRDAIRLAQDRDAEYGYTFVNAHGITDVPDTNVETKKKVIRNNPKEEQVKKE